MAIDYLEIQIGLGAPIFQVLRIFCLLTLIDNGLKQKQVDEIKKEII